VKHFTVHVQAEWNVVTMTAGGIMILPTIFDGTHTKITCRMQFDEKAGRTDQRN